MDFELVEWVDGMIRLSYWDSLEGKDRHFFIGIASGDTYEEDDNDDRCHRVNLGAELYKMLSEQDVIRS